MALKMNSPVKQVLVFILCIQIQYIHAEEGVIYSRHGSTEEWQDHFCIYYNPGFKRLPMTRDTAIPYNLTNLSSKQGCNASDYDSVNVHGNIVLVARGNCQFSTKALIAQEAGATGIVIASDNLIIPAPNSTADYNITHIIVATSLWSSVNAIEQTHGHVEVLMYSPDVGKFDPNIVVFFLISITCILIGGYLSGVSKLKKQLAKSKPKKKKKAKKTASDENVDSETEQSQVVDDKDEEQDDDEVDISLPAIFIFFIITCTFLVLLYFFYDYLVYVVIGVFCLAGSTGLFYCVQPIMKLVVPFRQRLCKNRVPFFRNRPEYRDLILLLICLGVGIFWGVERHAKYAWVLQDILGYCFCINAMKVVSIPNLKICTVLLFLLFVYDIFFVFITPLLTSNGDSIMVKVATGGDSKTNEQLPMVFKVPRLASTPITVCPHGYSLLGFGDIMLPGLLVAHNHWFDLQVGSKKLYFICTTIAYAVGLGFTYIALAVMEKGQPALLYLVPCTLGTTFLIGCLRGEVKMLWTGYKSKTVSEPKSDDVSSESVNQSSQSIPSMSSDSSTENENRELLRTSNNK